MAETLAILKKRIKGRQTSSAASAKKMMAMFDMEDLEDNIWETTANIDLVSWATGTDAQIKAMIDGYYSGNVTLAEIQSVWKIGDSRPISLSSMAATGVGEAHAAQNVYLTIVGFNTDELVTETDNGITKALITVQQQNGLDETGYMNSTDTNDKGWGGSARRAWCNNIYYNALPSTLKELVKSINKTTALPDGTTEITEDKVWLPIDGEYASYYVNNTTKIKKVGENSKSWWLRKPSTTDNKSFEIISSTGEDSTGAAAASLGIAPVCSF